jgi:hypothetical protein
LQLSAPTTGDYAGMLMYGDRTNTADVKLNGTADSLFTGNIYFANQAVQYLGNFSGKEGCTRVVAKTIDWSGNAEIKQNCTGYGMKPIPAQQLVRLVE